MQMICGIVVVVLMAAGHIFYIYLAHIILFVFIRIALAISQSAITFAENRPPAAGKKIEEENQDKIVRSPLGIHALVAMLPTAEPFFQLFSEFFFLYGTRHEMLTR